MRLLPERDCSQCSARQKAEWGCEKASPIPMVFDGKETRRCPCRVLHPDEGNRSGLSDVLWYYGRYKSGFLPEPGALLDQSAKLMEQFRVIDSALAHVDEAERKEMEQKRAASAALQPGANGRARPRPRR